MAQDEAREAIALEWAEATIGDVGDETAYLARADHSIQTLVYLLIDGDGQLFLHRLPPGVTRVIYVLYHPLEKLQVLTQL